MNFKLNLVKDLFNRYIDEINNPTGYIYGDYPDSKYTYQNPNKSKLKRLRLLLLEIMKEVEGELK